IFEKSIRSRLAPFVFPLMLYSSENPGQSARPGTLGISSPKATAPLSARRLLRERHRQTEAKLPWHAFQQEGVGRSRNREPPRRAPPPERRAPGRCFVS